MFSGMANAIAEGIIAYKAVEAIGRQLEAAGDITRTMLVGQAVSETTGIYSFVIALALVFANPLIGFLVIIADIWEMEISPIYHLKGAGICNKDL